MFGGGGGGLFGDLPPSATEAAAAAAATSVGDGAETSEGDKKRRRTQQAEGDEVGGDGQDRARDVGASVSSGLAPTSTKAATAAAPSLVDAIGRAGTAMAFVPAALARPRGVVGTTVRKSGGGVGGGGLGTAAARQQKHRHEEVRVERAEKLGQQAVQAKEPLHATRTVDEDEGRQEEATTADPSKKMGEGTSSGVGSGDDGGGGEGGEESEEMRTLHASVTDPYDPLVPNDYLAVREERRAAARRKELEKEALETIKAQQEMRERIAEERRRIEATGDARLIAASRGEGGGTGLGAGAGGAPEEVDGAAAAVPQAMGRGRGRGRGRGVSNLPAWLIQKQQEQEAAAAATAGQFDDTGAAARESGRDESGDRRLVALRNMVAPGETDDELAQEVREECEESCGPVSSVTVRDADETCSEVRVLVLFERAVDAKRASTLFHGRQFAGRRVSAELVGGGGDGA